MRILIIGATGYVGGSLVEHLRDAGHSVTGLVRTSERASYLRSRGAAAVIGDLADRELLAAASGDADAVINTAESDDVDLARNLIAPLEGTGKLLVHTSGSSIVVDDAKGAFASETILEDDMPYSPMSHRLRRVETDHMVRIAGITGGLRSAVICPTTIYGEGRGWKRDSHQIPLLVRQSIDRGAGVYIGAGKPVWSNVFLGDLLDLYGLIIEKAPSGSFFFAENGEASWAQIAEAISASLGFGGRTESWPFEEAVAAVGGVARVALASNCRVRATNARGLLGWSPNGPGLADALASGA